MTRTNTEQTPADPKLRGHLVIYVDGYKVYDKYLRYVLHDGEQTVVVPDRLVPPPDHEIASDEWWRDGWAVGDNARGRLCMRFGVKPLRRFSDFDEAVSYVYRRQQMHKGHRHVLVYVTTGIGGKEQMEVVRSLDDINAIEARIATEIAENAAVMAKRRADSEAEHPHRKLLQEKFGRSVGFAMSWLLLDIREKGIDAAKASLGKGTYYRYMRQLRELGLVE